MTFREALTQTIREWGARHGERSGGRLSKKEICAFYVAEIGRAASVDELEAITLARVHESLGSGKKSLAHDDVALRQALQLIGRGVNGAMWRLRTNGSLLVNVARGTSLDADLQGRPGTRAVAREGDATSVDTIMIDTVANGSTVKLPYILRPGTRVTVIVAKADVPSWAPRPVSGETLDKLTGVVSYGGDAIIDSEHWDGED